MDNHSAFDIKLSMSKNQNLDNEFPPPKFY